LYFTEPVQNFGTKSSQEIDSEYRQYNKNIIVEKIGNNQWYLYGFTEYYTYENKIFSDYNSLDTPLKNLLNEINTSKPNSVISIVELMHDEGNPAVQFMYDKGKGRVVMIQVEYKSYNDYLSTFGKDFTETPDPKGSNVEYYYKYDVATKVFIQISSEEANKQ
jgi:hypothetical protein